VAEGRELPIHSRRAALNLARAQYRSQVLESNRAYQECANSQAPLIRSTDTLVSSPDWRAAKLPRRVAAGSQRQPSHPCLVLDSTDFLRCVRLSSQRIHRVIWHTDLPASSTP